MRLFHKRRVQNSSIFAVNRRFVQEWCARMAEQNDVQMAGVLFLAFEQACINLRFFVDAPTEAFLHEIQPDQWYPLTLFNQLLDLISARYAGTV